MLCNALGDKINAAIAYILICEQIKAKSYVSEDFLEM